MTSPDGVPDASATDAPVPLARLALGRLALGRPDLDLSPLLPSVEIQLRARRLLDPLDLPPGRTTTSLGSALGRGAARACFGVVDAVRGRRRG